MYKDQNEKVIDAIEIVNDSWIATKVALHGVIYIFNLNTALSKIKDDRCVVKPAYLLKWSDTDNYFMSCGIGLSKYITYFDIFNYILLTYISKTYRWQTIGMWRR